MHLVYIDAFRKNNSNHHWLDVFVNKFDTVIPVNIDDKWSQKEIINLIFASNPDIVHMGGSIKLESHVSIDTIKYIRSKVKRITAFYGDRYWLSYIQERAKIIDGTWLTNAALINNDKMFYHPCPVQINWNINNNIEPKYDLAFIGNNYPAYETRRKFIAELAKEYSVIVWGGGDWKKIPNITYKGLCDVSDAPFNYNHAKIVLDDPVNDECTFNACGHKCFKGYKEPIFKFVCKNIQCKDFKPTYKYFSNRIPIAMLSRRPILAANRNGMNEVVKNVVYYNYKNMNDVKRKINYLLSNKQYRDDISNNAYNEVKNWTFDNLADRFIGGL